MSIHILLGTLVLLFLIGAFNAALAKRHRDYMIRTMNSPWYLPRTRAIGVFQMLVALVAALMIAANYGIDFSWSSLKL